MTSATTGSRFAAKRSKGPKATLEEFRLIVLEEIGSPQDEPFYVWEVVLHLDDADRLEALVGNRRNPRWKQDAALLLLNFGPRRYPREDPPAR